MDFYQKELYKINKIQNILINHKNNLTNSINLISQPSN
jgi:hypothetical protein